MFASIIKARTEPFSCLCREAPFKGNLIIIQGAISEKETVRQESISSTTRSSFRDLFSQALIMQSKAFNLDLTQPA